MATTKATTLAHTIASTTSSTADLNYAKTLNDTGVTSTEFDKLDGLTATTTELNKLSGATATTNEINLVDGSVSGPLSHRNMIINGAMNIDQRNSGSAVTISPNAYTLDRWKGLESSSGDYTIQQVADAPADFKNSLKVTVTTDSGAYGATDYASIQYAVEGQDMAHLNWGTSDAKTVTLSFWVKSSLTGTFGGAFANSAQNPSYPFSYTISSASTWEKKTITVAGSTSGTWLTTNGTGCYIFMSLGQGTTYSGTAGSWTNAVKLGPSSAVQVLDTNGATFQITGVQLEFGSVATPFEHRSYADELRRCQRYFQVHSNIALKAYITPALTRHETYVPLPVPMRVTPTRAVTTVGNATNVRSSAESYSGLNYYLTSDSVVLQMESDGAGIVAINGRTETLAAEL